MKKKHNVAIFTPLKVMSVNDLLLFFFRPQELGLAPGHNSALDVGSDGQISWVILIALWAR